jgi:hypothetical protein
LKEKQVKKVVFLLMGFCFCKTAFAAEPNEVNSIDSLRFQIAQLKVVISEQEKQLTQLKKENIRLKSLCQQAGIDIKETSTQSINERCIYRGRDRDSAWIERMFKRCGKYIADVNGQYIDIRGTILENSKEKIKYRKNIPTGTILKLPYGYKVLQSLGQSELLIHRRPTPTFTTPPTGPIGSTREITREVTIESLQVGNKTPEEPSLSFPEIIHIRGCQQNYTDDESFESPVLISEGIYNYRTPLGSTKTVPSLSLLEIQPITKEQFIEAINTGLLLYEYIENKDGKIEKHLML